MRKKSFRGCVKGSAKWGQQWRASQKHCPLFLRVLHNIALLPICFSILVMGLMPRPALALTSEELKGICASESFADQSLCFGYIEGALDILSVAPELQRTFQVCIRGGMSKGDFFDRISRYLRARYRPASLEEASNAMYAVFEAVQSVYPCTEDFFPSPVTIYETIRLPQQQVGPRRNSGQFIQQQSLRRIEPRVNPYLPPPPPQEER